MKRKILLSVILVFVLVLSMSTTVFADDGEGGDVESPPADNEDGGNGEESPPEEDCCEVLPVGDEPPVDGTFTVDAAIPGSGNAAMTGDLEVEGETFDDVPAVCGDGDKVIYIGTPTEFEICAVNDTNCINTLRSGYPVAPLTEEEADQYGRSFDSIFRESATSGDYNPAVNSFRWLTGYSGADPNPFEGVIHSEIIGTWIGTPDGSGIQPIAWGLWEYCEYDIPEDPAPKPQPKPVKVQPNLGAELEIGFLVPILMGLGILVKKQK
jgi:hypothetical protein